MTTVWAGNPILIDASFERVKLLEQLDCFVSPLEKATFSSILASTNVFAPLERPALNFPQGKNAIWLRFTAINDTDAPLPMVLDVGSVVVNYTQLFTVRPNGVVDSTSLIGDWVPFNARQLPYRIPSLPFTLQPNEEVVVYFYAHKYNESIVLPLRLWTREAWVENLTKEEIWTGVILVVGIIMLLVSYLLLFVARSGQTAAYALFVSATVLYVCLHRGVGGQYLWPAHPVFNNALRIPLFSTCFLSLLLFVQHFLAARSEAPRLYRLIDVLVGLFGVAILLACFEYRFPEYIKPLFPLFASIEVVAILLLLYLPIWHYYRFRQSRSLIFLLAFLFTFSMAIIGVLGVGFGVPINNFWINKIIYFGLLGDSCILLGLLAYEQFSVRKERQQLAVALAASREESVRNLLHGQMSERKRLARQLHDGMGVMLASLRMRMSNYLRMQSGRYESEIAGMVTDLGRVSEDLRNFSHNLAPAALEKYGLVAALKDQIFQLNLNTPKVTLTAMTTTDAAKGLDKLQQETLYFIALELINNALKHAHATEITLVLERKGGQVLLIVKDNGIGYQKDIRKSGSGLHHIELRLQLVKGRFTISPNVPRGSQHMVALDLAAGT